MHHRKSSLLMVALTLVLNWAVPAFAQGWVPASAPVTNWSCLAFSADGSTVAAGIDQGTIYISTNSGETWQPSGAPNENWTGIACSADGTIMVGVTLNTGAYYSWDSGRTWAVSHVVPGYFHGVAASADGSHFAATPWSQIIELSTNSGADWLATSSQNADWDAIAMSADGHRLVAADYNNGPIYCSPDSGATWTETSAPNEDWSSVACSADGMTMAAAGMSMYAFGEIYLSTDGGTNWVWTHAPNVSWNSISCSADGLHFLAAGHYSYYPGATPGIYLSIDGGGTWTLMDAPGTNWGSAVLSANFTTAAAITTDGQLYTMKTTSAQPACETGQAQAGDGGVLLTGLVTPNALDSRAWFEWGTSTNYGNIITVAGSEVGWTNVEVSAAISGLSPNVVYHYRLVATNALGCAYGSDVAFSFPSIQLNGPAVMTNECHMPFADPGATAVGLSPPPPLIAIAAGAYHSLALLTNGSVVGWGFTSYGEANPPAEATNVVAISAGGHHSMALRADGSVVCWGEYIGSGVISETETDIVDIAAGGGFDMALKADGTIVGWGTYGVSKPFYVPVGLTNVVAISATESDSWALLKNGSIVGWGANWGGETNVPASATNIVAVSGGTFHCIALRADGTVIAWGSDFAGQLDVPADATNIVSISAGLYHNMALRADGRVFVWGSNLEGETNIPPAATNIVEIAAGYYHCLARTASGLVIGWGDDSFGETTTPGELTPNYSPVTVSGNFDGDSPGTYTLIYSATNSEGNFNQTFRTVVVVDTTPPQLFLPTVQVAEFNNLNGAAVSPNVQAFDLCSGILPVTCTPPSGSVFAIGTNRVWASATDDSGNTSRQQLSVVVVGARGVMKDVLSEITTSYYTTIYPPPLLKDASLLIAAAAGLTRATANNVWLDEMNVVTPYGANAFAYGTEVFAGNQAAVQALTDLSNLRNSPTPQIVLNEWISRLERASRYLAMARMNAALKAGFTNRQLTPAILKLSVGDLNVQSHHYAAAIADYQMAWKFVAQWIK
jgi:hypothetical protein